MDTNPKRAVALEILAKTGIWRSNYEPPMLRLFWRLGFDIPPPHFASFWSIALLMGLFFGVAWSAFMWTLVWAHQGMPLLVAVVIAAVVGTFFGCSMAAYYAYGRRKHKLPLWKDL